MLALVQAEVIPVASWLVMVKLSPSQCSGQRYARASPIAMKLLLWGQPVR